MDYLNTARQVAHTMSEHALAHFLDNPNDKHTEALMRSINLIRVIADMDEAEARQTFAHIPLGKWAETVSRPALAAVA